MGLGERRKLPQRSPRRSPGRKRILVHFELEKTNLVTTNLNFCHCYSASWSHYLQGCIAVPGSLCCKDTADACKLYWNSPSFHWLYTATYRVFSAPLGVLGS